MLEALTGPVKALLMAGFVGLMLIAELAQAPRAGRERARARRWPLNLAFLILTLGLGRLLAAVGPVAAALWAHEQGLGLLHDAPAPLAWVISLLAFDLLLYAQHRAMHEVPGLWRLHRVHHTDPTLDVTSAWRFHPFEIVLSLALKSALAIALGAPPEAVAIYETVLALGAVFTHADIRLPPTLDRALRLVIATPAVHERHHAIVRGDRDTNYSGTLTLWDRLFGTYRAPTREGMAHLGLAGVSAETAARITAGFLEPYAKR